MIKNRPDRELYLLLLLKSLAGFSYTLSFALAFLICYWILSLLPIARSTAIVTALAGMLTTNTWMAIEERTAAARAQHAQLDLIRQLLEITNLDRMEDAKLLRNQLESTLRVERQGHPAIPSDRPLASRDVPHDRSREFGRIQALNERGGEVRPCRL